MVTSHAHESAALLRVSGTADIEYLVKESEVLTGRPGRQFVIAGADRLVYRIYWHPIGCKVQRLNEAERVISTHFVLHMELQGHSLGAAVRAGQLYTPAMCH